MQVQRKSKNDSYFVLYINSTIGFLVVSMQCNTTAQDHAPINPLPPVWARWGKVGVWNELINKIPMALTKPYPAPVSIYQPLSGPQLKYKIPTPGATSE